MPDRVEDCTRKTTGIRAIAFVGISRFISSVTFLERGRASSRSI